MSSCVMPNYSTVIRREMARQERLPQSQIRSFCSTHGLPFAFLGFVSPRREQLVLLSQFALKMCPNPCSARTIRVPSSHQTLCPQDDQSTRRRKVRLLTWLVTRGVSVQRCPRVPVAFCLRVRRRGRAQTAASTRRKWEAGPLEA